MVTRVISVSRVRVINRRPAIGGMADVTIRRGVKMIPPLTGCRITIMTGHAVAINALVIPSAADKGGRGMTEVAIQVGRDMLSTGPRQFSFHSNCIRTIVTIGTAIHYTSVIKRCRNKSRCIVADTTILTGLHMIHGFTCGVYAIMTEPAIIYDTRVIKRSWQEARR